MSRNKSIIPSWVLFGAAGLAFAAIADLPYGFYMLLRWVVCGGGIVGAIQFYRWQNVSWVWVLGITALIFNPIFRFSFEREIWRMLDAIAGIVLLVAALSIKKRSAGNP